MPNGLQRDSVLINVLPQCLRSAREVPQRNPRVRQSVRGDSFLRPLPPFSYYFQLTALSVLTTQKVLRAAQALHIPIYTTTQNAARLGAIVPDLTPLLSPPHVRAQADKTLFSMWLPALTSVLDPKADIVLVGIESHICITQTALDARRAGHKVYVLADAVSSCNKEEVPIALARLRAEGMVVTTSESWLYEVVGDAGAPEFKSLIGIVKDTMPDTKTALAALAPVHGGSKI